MARLPRRSRRFPGVLTAVSTGLRLGVGIRALLTIVFVALATALPASAQTGPTSAAQSAREFLAITDRDDGKASWDVAGQQFRDGVTKVKWSEMLRATRAPLGAVKSRKLESTEFMDAFPGAKRNGSYALLTFRTQFAAREAVETITLEREADGLWAVIGYFIR
jgi:hypothetical protein